MRPVGGLSCAFWFTANEFSAAAHPATHVSQYPRNMSPTATQRKPTARKKKRAKSAGWITWWPLLLGILVTPLTVRAAVVMALAGPDALRLLYPYVQLVQNPLLAFPTEVASTLSQAMMYLQFPFYGLLAALILRAKGLLPALITIAVVHFGAVGIVIALAHL